MRDDEDSALVASLVGRTIVRARWFDAHPERDWTGHEEAWLWLDDGRVIEFGGWGHDAWGATVTEIRVVDVAQCRHCGEPHPTTRVTRDAGGKATGAWCTDRIHLSWRPEDG